MSLEFEKLEELKQFFQRVVQAGEQKAFHVIPLFSPDFIKDVTVLAEAEVEKVTIIKCGEWGWPYELKKVLVPGVPSTGVKCPMNERVVESHLFPTAIPGLVLQVVAWAEAWNAFGGGSIGGETFFWLTNEHPPLQTTLEVR